MNDFKLANFLALSALRKGLRRGNCRKQLPLPLLFWRQVAARLGPAAPTKISESSPSSHQWLCYETESEGRHGSSVSQPAQKLVCTLELHTEEWAGSCSQSDCAKARRVCKNAELTTCRFSLLHVPCHHSIKVFLISAQLFFQYKTSSWRNGEVVL